MRSTGKLLVLLLTLALALPTAVLAQSAGDQQYVDPFQGQDGGGGGNGGGGDNGSQTGGSDDGTTSTTAQTTPGDTAGTTAQGTESGEATLPNTGLALLPVALIGTFLFAAGIVLRRGARLPSVAPSLAGAPAALAPPALARPVPTPRAAAPAPATAPRAGLPAVGFGLVGLFILSKALRRRA